MIVCKVGLHIGGTGLRAYRVQRFPDSDVFSSHLWFLNSQHCPLNVISNL